MKEYVYFWADRETSVDREYYEKQQPKQTIAYAYLDIPRWYTFRLSLKL